MIFKLITNSILIAYLSVTGSMAQKLIWSDEFNYLGLPDSNKWGNEVGYIRNNELQYYTDKNPDNQIVRNGNLELILLKKNYEGFQYTSASINTLGKFTIKYGRIEARMKLPVGKGLWPAFWTLGTSIELNGWPDCGEIDIMEHINAENKIYGNAHWSGPNGLHKDIAGGKFELDVTQYHLYSVDWNDSIITWAVDSIKYHQLIIKEGINGTAEFHKPHYLLLNLAIGGSWPGNPDATTVFPSTVFVDYVRVYRNKKKGK
jgi:beta-glucanase (GH16 family)